MSYEQISEEAFTAQVIHLARWFGWKVAHFRPAMTKRGRWVTAVQGDGAGFPDLVLVRANRLIFAELKAERGRLAPKQEAWLESLKNAGMQACLWRPGDIDQIERILK